MNRKALAALALAAAVALALAGCKGVEEIDDRGPAADGGIDAGADAAPGDGGEPDTETSTETDVDTDTATDDSPVIEMDCSACPAIGGTLDELLCALDVCDPAAVVAQEYATLEPACSGSLADTYEAVERFGAPSNDLAPMLNGSYALLATGPATGAFHSQHLCPEGGATDPYNPAEGATIYDAMEWRIALTAPPGAGAFRFKYVFFSEEYDDYVGTTFNDKFYAVIEAASTSDGAPTIINHTLCRDPVAYYDFVCGADDIGCDEGAPQCYVAINTAYSECCWYGGCPDGPAETDLAGTGFECAASQLDDSSTSGSSTGWLQTVWPIEGGETFALTFHLHDTADGIFDSEVILDAFEFVVDGYYDEYGTTEVVIE